MDESGPIHRRSIRVRLVDLPGALHQLTSLVAVAGVNIVRLEVVSRDTSDPIQADQRDCLVHGAVAGNEFDSSLVAIAESIRDPGDGQRAEYALAALDPWQNKGIGTLLTRHVARIAPSTGIRLWETSILA